MPRALLTAVVAVLLGPQFAQPDSGPALALEHELGAVLQWEILWGDSPDGFRLPSNETRMAAALYSATGMLAYCSHDMGVCAEYVTARHRNWMRDRSAKCEGTQSDEQAVLDFVGKQSEKEALGVQGKRRITVGRGGVMGIPAAGSGILWTAAIPLAPRSEILKHYSGLHPPELRGIEQWLRATILPNAGYRTITIACFAPTDPVVYLYGDRPVKGPIVFSIYWDEEAGDWAQAGMLERPDDRGKIQEMRTTVNAIACATVRF